MEREMEFSSPMPEEGETAEKKSEVLGPDAFPTRLSSALHISPDVSLEARQEFIRKAQEIYAKRNKTNCEKEWLTDYMEHQIRLLAPVLPRLVKPPSQRSSQSAYSENQVEVGQEVEYGPGQSFQQEDVRPADLNKLFVRPETFNGVKPPPRQWLDQYEKAAISNNWSDAAKIKYMATFLKETTYSWLTEVVPLHTPSGISWKELRSLFVKCCMGESDRQSAKREFDRAIQREGEKAAQFIPRMVQMIKTLDPSRKQDVITDDIRHKLLPEYLEKLFELKTIQHLYDACTEIEAGMAASKAASKRREMDIHSESKQRSRQTSRGRSPSRDRGDSPRGSTPERAKSPLQTPDDRQKDSSSCYRCGRSNHWSRDCIARTKLDGTPLKEQPGSGKAVRFNTLSVVTEGETSSEMDSSSDNDEDAQESQQAEAPRRAGRNLLCTTVAVIPETGLIRQLVFCNGRAFNAIVDTGAFVSTVDARVAAENNWQLKPSNMKLFHAVGERMNCLGVVELKSVIQLNNVTRSLKHGFMVVENLCTEVIIGIDIIRALHIVINPAEKHPLRFAKLLRAKGVRAEETVLPPRSVSLVNGVVDTDSVLVLITPFGFDNAVHVGHTVCNVNDKRVSVPVLDLESQRVKLGQGTQIAGVYPLFEGEPTLQRQVMATLPLSEEVTETVVIGDNLTQNEKDSLAEVLHANIRAFSVNAELGLSTTHQHTIELLPNAKPFVEPVRRHPNMHVEEANRQVRDMLEKGIIEESTSPWASEYVMVKKKTGEWRMCVDYRRLNTLTKKNSFPLPNIEECLGALAGKIYFSKLDFASGYRQMPVEERSRELTAFRTGEGLYQFKVMPFGLTNAPASFQKMINLMFADLKGLNLQVFLDDVCLTSSTWSEHVDLIDKYLKTVIMNNLKLKASKCVFGVNEITFLGHKISKEGITQDPDKLRPFRDLPAPTNVQEVHRILGAFGYYRRFVYRFSALAEPIIKLTRKEERFSWGAEQEAAFTALKDELLCNATLSHYSQSDPTMLKTDACREGLAGMLLQQRGGDWKLVSCVSRRLSKADQNYSVTEMEGLAIVYSVQKLRPYLLGRSFVILTDHCALCALGKKLSQNARLRRWAIILSEFDFSIEYRKGSAHCDVDCLSRAPVCDADDKYLEHVLALPEVLNLPTPINPQE